MVLSLLIVFSAVFRIGIATEGGYKYEYFSLLSKLLMVYMLLMFHNLYIMDGN